MFKLAIITLFLIFKSSTLVRSDDGPEEFIPLEIKEPTGEHHVLKLTKPETSVLHPEIQIVSIIQKEENPQHHIADIWTPSKDEITAAERNLYVDPEKLATIRLHYDQTNKSHFAESGVLNGKNIRDLGQRETTPANKGDYIDIGRTLTPKLVRQGNGAYVVEVVLVCDKEFSDIFNQDRRRILDYWTVYFWDINMRYKTLPNINISFRINGIVIINSPGGQPFIEESRASDGRAEFGRILDRFSKWIYGQMGGLPKFDIAIAITNARLEWGGGLAYFRAACGLDNNSRRHWGTVIWNDNGGWGSVTVGAHEIAHSVGAPHDDDHDFPGGCQDRGFIMSGGNDDLKWFFSTCSDRKIGEFVRSNEASCLARLDETGRGPEITTDFSWTLAPSMQDQCRRRLNNQKAFTKDDEEGNCKARGCWLDNGNGWNIWTFAPVDNTPCAGSGRCFRGRCRPAGSVLQNVGTRQCALARNPFGRQTIVDMVACPNPTWGATPLERFALEESRNNGRFFNTPYATADAKENGDKCLYTGYGEGDALWTDTCNYENPWQGWDVLDQGNGEFMMKHRVTERCMKQSGGWAYSRLSCDSNDANFRWRFI